MYAELIDRKGPVNTTVFWIGISCLFLVFCGVLYYPAISGGWFLDDFPNIVRNDSIKNFSVSLQNAFTRRGISYLWFAVDFSLWGLDPHLSRMVNIVIHLCNSLLVVALCLEIVGRKRTGIAVVVGMVFLCHPLQTSAVNYVVQRMSLLSALFALCSLLLLCRYFKATETGAKTQQVFMLCCAVFAGMLSVLSKENTVLIICLVPFVARLIGKGHMRGGWFFATVVYTVVPLVAVIAHFLAVDSILGGVDGAVFYQDTGAPFYFELANHDYLPVRYLLSQGEVFWVYLKLIFFPFEQALDYGWPIPDLEFSFLPVFTFVLIAGAWIAVFKKRGQYPLSFFGFHWVLFFTAVESSIIPLDPIFEHRLYLLMVGICLIVVEQLTIIIANKKVLTVMVLFSLVFYSTLSWNRNTVWGNSDKSFWMENHVAVEKAYRPRLWLGALNFRDREFSESARFYLELGEIANYAGPLKLAGEALYFGGQKAKAYEIFSRTVERPEVRNSFEVFNAYDAAEKGQMQAMEAFLRRAEAKNPRDLRIPLLRAQVAERRSDYLTAAIQAQKVIVEWNKKSSLGPGEINEIGYVDWARSLRKKALAELNEWLRLQQVTVEADPVNIKLRSEFANQLLLLGMYSRAKEHYKVALELVPEAWNLYYNLGLVSDREYDFFAAVDYYHKALRLSPENRLVLEHYASALIALNNYEEAGKYLKEVTVLWPSSSKAWRSLGNVLEKTGDSAGAKDCYEKAGNFSR